MNMGLILGAGLLLWLWYQSQGGSVSLPPDAAYLMSVPAGEAYLVPQSFASSTTIASGSATTAVSYLYYGPAEQLYYLVATAPTSAQTAAGQALAAPKTIAPTSPATPATPTTPAAPAAPATPASPATPAPTSGLTSNGEPATYTGPGNVQLPTPTTLAGLWTAIQGWAAADTSFTNSGGVLSGLPDHWNFYVPYVWPNAPTGYSGGSWPPNINTVFPGVNVNTPMTAAQFWAGMQPYLQQGGLSGLSSLRGMGAIRSPFWA